MTLAGLDEPIDNAPNQSWGSGWRLGPLLVAPYLVIQLLYQVARDSFPESLASVDPDDVIPMREWANRFVNYLRQDEFLGLFSVKTLTRTISGWLEWPLDLSERIFIADDRIDPRGWVTWLALIALGAALGAVFGRERWALRIAGAVAVIAFVDQIVGTMPWIMIVALFTVLGLWLGGWRSALMAGTFIFYLAIFDLWEDSMITLSMVAVAAPVAAGVGWTLGLLGSRSRRFEQFLSPFLNILQSMPVLAYLLPISAFVGIGDEAGAIATIVFALAPMARLTMLGLQAVPDEVKEAGIMSGCNPRQMLWKVELPAAKAQLMVGINQVIMQVLAMTVLASFVGTRGLGLPLLNFLQSLRIGKALQVGIGIVLIAVVLDRLSQVASQREPTHRDEGEPLIKRYWFPIAVITVAVVSTVLASIADWAKTFPERWAIDTSEFWDRVVRWPRDNWIGDFLGEVRDWTTVEVLIPMRDGFQAIPWIGLLMLVGAIAWRLGGWRLAAAVGAWVLFLAWSGFWLDSLETLYLVVAALILSMIIGVPLGIIAASTDRRTAIMQGFLDTLQVMPSFIYLIPAVMLFSIGAFSAIMAILIYATVPAVRYTMLGLRNVPEDKIEAATTSGCTPWQTLWKVRMPIALPEIILGVNQVLNFGMLLVIIAAFIGGIGGLGDVILIARTEAGLAGESLLAGFCVVAMLQIADQLVTGYAHNRKSQLGLD